MPRAHRPLQIYPEFLRTIMHIGLVVPFLYLFTPAAVSFGAITGGYLLFSLIAGGVVASRHAPNQIFSASMTALTVSFIGMLVGTTALVSTAALIFGTGIASLMTAPTIILPLAIAVSAGVVATAVSIVVLKAMNWLSDRFSNMLENGRNEEIVLGVEALHDNPHSHIQAPNQGYHHGNGHGLGHSHTNIHSSLYNHSSVGAVHGYQDGMINNGGHTYPEVRPQPNYQPYTSNTLIQRHTNASLFQGTPASAPSHDDAYQAPPGYYGPHR